MYFGSGRKFKYEYTLKDHLANSRVTFMGSNLGGGIDVVQTTNYYPFGLVMNKIDNNSDPTLPKNKYLYNGKEIQNETLNGAFFGMYDYGARFYDPQIGRWMSIDPHAEKNRRLNPYNYCKNNPIRFIDPDGKDAYTVDSNGNIKLLCKNDNHYDVLIAVGESGKLNIVDGNLKNN